LSRFGLGELCTIIVNAAPNIKTNKHTMYARLAKLALPSPIISIVPYYGIAGTAITVATLGRPLPACLAHRWPWAEGMCADDAA
jgi:hypothetical protein